MRHGQHHGGQRQQLERCDHCGPVHGTAHRAACGVGQRDTDQHQAQRGHRRAQQQQGFVQRAGQRPAGQAPHQAGHHRQHHRVDQGVAQRALQRAPQAGAGLMVGPGTRQVDLSQRGERRQQQQRMQADQRDVDAQPGLAKQRESYRDAHLHRVAKHHRDGPCRGRCRRLFTGGQVRLVLAASVPALEGVNPEQHQHHRQEKRQHRGPGHGRHVEPGGGSKQQRRHEDVVGRVAQQPRGIEPARRLAQPAHAPGSPAQRHRQKDRQQLVEDQQGHGCEGRASGSG